MEKDILKRGILCQINEVNTRLLLNIRRPGQSIQCVDYWVLNAVIIIVLLDVIRIKLSYLIMKKCLD